MPHRRRRAGVRGWLPSSLVAGWPSLVVALATAVVLGEVVRAAGPLQGEAGRPLYLDPDQTPQARARDLVSRMTLEEKVRQMQNNAPAIPELHVPAYNWWSEALHGVARAGQATVFPQAIGLAATWDTNLMHRVAEVISTEARAKYNDAIRHDDHSQYFGLTFWSPNINIFRDPRWGRGQETYGEDPYLTARFAVAFITGMQGDDPTYIKVIATAKHFAVHSGPESTRHSIDVAPSDEDLERTYLPAFRAAVVEGHVGSVMCAYNSIDGVPACANTTLLDTHLKGWGFNGYVVSDCGAIRDIYAAAAHHYADSAMQASALAVKAGTDLTCGREYLSLVDAVRANLISETDLDRALVRLFTARFALGMFDPPERVPYASIPYSEVDSAAHRALALEAARESIVLLKNTGGALPLGPHVSSIAVIGPSADDAVAVLGNYNGVSSAQVTPLDGLTRRFAGRATVRYALGSAYVTGALAVIPAEAFSPPSGHGHGVRAEYFDNGNFNGSPRLSRIEQRPSLPPVRDPHLTEAGVPFQGFSVRWTGRLTTAVDGPVQFGVRGSGAAIRMFLDNVEVAAASGISRTQNPAPRPRVLQRGRTYSIRVEYRALVGRVPSATDMDVQWLPPSAALLKEAMDLVRRSDVTIAFVGLNSNLEGEEMTVHVPGFDGGDRTDLSLPAPQVLLLRAALATGKPVVVVLTSGSAVALTWAADRAAAILAAWYGGEEIGTAIADTIAGANNPAGRLPVTFYRSVDQLPPFDDYAMVGRTYRYFRGDALYPFGFGLSYSTFAYSDGHRQSTSAGLELAAVVRNTSSRPGDEVAELYVSGERGPHAPLLELKGFQRVHLEAGESRTVAFTVDRSALPPGALTFTIGGGQPTGSTPHVTILP